MGRWNPGCGDRRASAVLCADRALVPGASHPPRLAAAAVKKMVASGLAAGTVVCAIFGAVADPALADTCPNAAIRSEQASGHLAGCRAYEQVSPVDKNGNPVGSWTGDNAATNRTSAPFLFGDDGNSALLAYYGAAPGSKYGGNMTLRATRTSQGWQATPLMPDRVTWRPSATFREIPRVFDANADTSRVVFWHSTFAPGFVMTQRLDVLDPSGTESVLSRGSLGGPDLLGSALYGGMSRDGSHMTFVTSDVLEPEASALQPGAPMLYEKLMPSGQLRPVGILPDGALAENGAVLGSGGYTGEGIEDAVAESREAMSDDGRHIIFSASETLGAPSELYARIDGQRTVEISQSQRAVAGSAATTNAWYQDASRDGSHVFFLSDGQLTDDDTDAFVDLYRFDFNSGETGGTLTRVSPDLGDSALLDNRVALVGASQDGQVVYFIANKALGSGGGVDGQPNLYLSDHGVVSLVATLADSGDPQNLSDDPYVQGAPNRFFGLYRAQQARVTPDGATIVFQSLANIGAVDAQGMKQVYVFHPGDAAPSCISCIDDTATGDASLVTESRESVVTLPRNLSDDGHTVFFQSDARLTREDRNTAQDIYEWHDGVVSLLSGGTGPDASLFLNAGPTNGKQDVFFLTTDRLVATDEDSAYDLYTARRDGGFAAPPVAPAACAGDACQGPEAPPASPPAVAGSVTFMGAGNLPDAPVAQRAPKVRITKPEAVTGTSATVKVTVPAAGAIRLSGSGVATAKRSAMRRATYTLRVALTAKAKASLKRHKTLTVRVRVAFTPKSGRSTSATLRVTFKQPKTPTKKRGSASTTGGR